MAKLNLKAGEKLDLAVRGSTEELRLKVSFVKETGDTVYLSPPILDGRAYLPELGSPVVLSWGGDGSEFSLGGVLAGTVKQGIRTYLEVRCEGAVQRRERRAFQRIPVEMEAELTCLGAADGSGRTLRLYPCRTSDLSGGGVALYTDAPIAVGETVDIVLCPKGGKRQFLRAVVCWVRPAPKREGFAFSSGLQFVFSNGEEGAEFAKLVASIASKS